jgi:hypothetical protein
MAYFGSWKGYVQVCGPRFDRLYGTVELRGNKREALARFRHRAQDFVVFLGPSFVLLTGKQAVRQGQVSDAKRTQLAFSEHRFLGSRLPRTYFQATAFQSDYKNVIARKSSPPTWPLISFEAALV